ncbi:isoamyl acetate-hydrolyzing esterase 1 homolog isoform X3 [Sapajus apella]|nr:isoamyl acetate-hydrolyzing esterase 1 homolog isoform X3 [Sapajus apella]
MNPLEISRAPCPRIHLTAGRLERAAVFPRHSQNHEVQPGFPQRLHPAYYGPSRVTPGAGGRARTPRPLLGGLEHLGGHGNSPMPHRGPAALPPRVLRSHSCPLRNAPAPAQRRVGLGQPPEPISVWDPRGGARAPDSGGSLAVGERSRRPSFWQTPRGQGRRARLGARPARLQHPTVGHCAGASPGWRPRPGLRFHGAVRGRGLRKRAALASRAALRGLHHPGYNTRWAKIILPRLIRKGNSLDTPVAVTIFFGANDSALKDENPKQHIALDEYAANLKSMVQYLKSVDIPENRVILITPTPLCETAWEKQCIMQGCKLNRLNSVVGEYANACLQVAQDCGTDILDLWTLMQDSQDFSSYLSDGLHLSPKGNEFLFSHLWPLIEKKVSSLPLLLPYWRDVAEAKPELSLLGDGDH